MKRKIDESMLCPVVDTSKLDAPELWAWARLSQAQQMCFESHLDFRAWVTRGSRNADFPAVLRTPKEAFV